jgi:hypothetical protein
MHLFSLIFPKRKRERQKGERKEEKKKEEKKREAGATSDYNATTNHGRLTTAVVEWSNGTCDGLQL